MPEKYKKKNNFNDFIFLNLIFGSNMKWRKRPISIVRLDLCIFLSIFFCYFRTICDHRYAHNLLDRILTNLLFSCSLFLFFLSRLFGGNWVQTYCYLCVLPLFATRNDVKNLSIFFFFSVFSSLFLSFSVKEKSRSDHKMYFGIRFQLDAQTKWYPFLNRSKNWMHFYFSSWFNSSVFWTRSQKYKKKNAILLNRNLPRIDPINFIRFYFSVHWIHKMIFHSFECVS